MGTYNKDKNILVTLQKITKEELKSISLKERRSVNNIINIAIENYISEANKNE